jgi:cell division protein FtsB
MAVRAQVAQLLQEQEELQERLANLQEGSLEMERLARERLGLARPGETLYRFR